MIALYFTQIPFETTQEDLHVKVWRDGRYEITSSDPNRQYKNEKGHMKIIEVGLANKYELWALIDGKKEWFTLDGKLVPRIIKFLVEGRC